MCLVGRRTLFPRRQSTCRPSGTVSPTGELFPDEDVSLWGWPGRMPFSLFTYPISFFHPDPWGCFANATPRHPPPPPSLSLSYSRSKKECRDASTFSISFYPRGRLANATPLPSLLLAVEESSRTRLFDISFLFLSLRKFRERDSSPLFPSYSLSKKARERDSSTSSIFLPLTRCRRKLANATLRHLACNSQPLRQFFQKLHPSLKIGIRADFSYDSTDSPYNIVSQLNIQIIFTEQHSIINNSVENRALVKALHSLSHSFKGKRPVSYFS